MEGSKNQRLIFTFSNSGVVQTFTRNPELITKLSPYRDKFPPTFSSSQIIQTPDSGFELKIDAQSLPPEWINNLKTQLEIPDDASLRHLMTSGAVFRPRWQNYNLRFVGIVIEESNQTECSWPYWRTSDSNGNSIELVQVWYQRVSCMYSPVYCDVRWQPDRGETVSFPGLENAKRGRDVTLAWRGRMLLRKLNTRGRPESSVSLTKDQFFERAPQVCAQYLDTFGEMPSDVQIAEGLYISKSTFYRYVDRYKLSLNEIRNMAINMLIEQNSPF